MYVLLFIEVDRPGAKAVPKFVSIFKLLEPPNIVVPAPVVGSAVNLNNSYPYVGAVPSVEIASLLSCQYLRTPVVESQFITLPTAVEPIPISCRISESYVNVVVVAPAPAIFKA